MGRAYTQEPYEGFDAWIEASLKRTECPGLAVAIVKDGQLLYAKGYGVRKLGSPERVDEHTIFAIGSNTKSMTAALIAMLVDEEKMKWDDKVIKFLPEFQLNDPTATREVTIKDLLMHRTGLPPTDVQSYCGYMSRDEIIRRLRYQPLTLGFRNQYSYQNAGYVVAGQCAASVMKDSWENAVRKRILAPLRMSSTVMGVHELASLTNVAQPHVKIDEKITSVRYQPLDPAGPSGSINSNVLDMSQWLKMVVADGAIDTRRMISNKSMEEMRKLQIPILPAGFIPEVMPDDDIEWFGYGLGWVVQLYRGHKIIRHNGGVDGQRSTMGVLADKRLGVIVLTNSDYTDLALPNAVFYSICDHFLGLPPKDWLGRYLTAIKKTEYEDKLYKKYKWGKPHPESKPTLSLDSYCGTYTSKLYGKFKIREEKGHLVLDFGPDRIADLTHWRYDTFKGIWRKYINPAFPDMFTFEINSEGLVQKVAFDTAGDFYKAPYEDPATKGY
jgi:CubicO group peptidase (beta-lactamase class C family)